jgi:cyclohexanecarboxylate-CoA ligase
MATAYPDDVLGERACAVVVPRPGETMSLAEIIAYLNKAQNDGLLTDFIRYP